MRVFDVYHHQEDGHQAVKQGFSWPGFFFGFLWALAKDLWIGFLVLFVAVAALVMSEVYFKNTGSSLGELLALCGQIALFVWVGFSGNNWRRHNLKKRNFVHLGSIAAQSPKAAIIALSSIATGKPVDA